MSGTTIIAEAGVNHNGSIDMALAMVEAASEAGADVVKFQTFDSGAMVSRYAQKAAYQKESTDAAESQLEMIRQYELSEDDHARIIKKCDACGIEFLSTPFDIPSLELLERLGPKSYKLSSGDVTNWPLIHRIGMTEKPLIMSTGMSTLDEIRGALGIFLLGALEPSQRPDEKRALDIFFSAQGRAYLEKSVTLLHCTTQYPTPLEDVNLLAMDLLREEFGLPVGYSDHSQGIFVSICAAAKSAAVIEKHFTLDKNLPGPDHKASVTPSELAELVLEVRRVERILGKKEKTVAASEAENVDVARKSLVALKDISEGEFFSHGNLGVKRPGGGVSPTKYWAYIGKIADRGYAQDEPIR